MRWAIIILNWNGADDTIECISSLWLQPFQSFDVFLIDNHSTDDSIDRIRKWCSQPYVPDSPFLSPGKQQLPSPIPLVEFKDIDPAPVSTEQKTPVIVLIRNRQNLGFARATNQGIALARKWGYTHVLLLNNDTVVTSKTLVEWAQALQAFPQYAAYQGAIYYYHKPEKIWNIGGVILPWGQTRYYRREKPRQVYRTHTLSGCALLLPMSTIQQVGELSERFFHGEEDFEYALRLKRAGLKACVVSQARVYHKVASSVTKQWGLRRQRLANGALNRLVHFKYVYPRPVWHLWRLVTGGYYWLLLVVKYHQSPLPSFQLVRRIIRKAGKISRVTPDVVTEVLREGT